MYKNYKTNLSKPSKPNLPKGQQKSLGTVSQKVVKPKPEWNDSVKDESNYKLSASELVQKKINLMSKHRLEAKEEWLERQEKLRRGVLDEETKKIYDTARQSKNLSTREDEIKRKNLSQMINFIEKPQKDSKVVVEQVKQNIEQTRKFIHKMEQYQNDEDPNRLLRVIDRLNKNQDQQNCNYDTVHQINRGQGSLRKSARSMSSQNMNSQRQNSLNENKLSDKKSSSQMQSDFFSSSSKENQKDMANYFHSLDKIEETIKFMEDKILCERKSPAKQNIAASKVVEKKLFNEVQENSENKKPKIQENTYNQQMDKDDFEFETNYHYNMIANKNQLEIKNFELIRDSQNATKQINTSRGSKNIDNDALSFNLTDCEDESQIHGFKNRFEQSLPKNYNRSRSQSQDKKIQSEFQGKKIQQENDLVVNDFKCNIDMIDPNMFFNNNQLKNEEINKNEYQYGNKKTYQPNSRNINEDTLKSDFQRNYEDTLSADNYHKQQKSNFVQQYDNIAQNKRQELSSQQATVKLQYDNQNDLYSKLKQQTEDDFDQFYANRIAPQPYTNNYFKETQKESEFVFKQPIRNYSVQQQAQEEEEQGGDDYLSRNIDQLKEILEATKKDLEKLENNNLDNDEFNYFSSQYQQTQQEGTIQGKKIQKTIPISRNNELSELQAMQSIKKVANNLLECPDNKQVYQTRTLSTSQNPGFINSYKQQEIPTNDVFMQDTNKTKQNNLFQDINDQQNFFTSNIFLCNNNSTQKANGQAESMYKQSDPYFTSNIFMNDNSVSNSNDLKSNQQNLYSNNQGDTQVQRNTNIVKQDMFKKSIQNYSNQGVKPQDSLYIRHHLK
ncbi:hypothetical protein ABPG74_002245 [Tetrahymena malaccensis]